MQLLDAPGAAADATSGLQGALAYNWYISKTVNQTHSHKALPLLHSNASSSESSAGNR
jgi:hypothetical protein